MNAVTTAYDLHLIDRLKTLSRNNSYNYYEYFDWPDNVDDDLLWCDEELLTTYGTDVHSMLSDEKKVALSHWECINFFSLNVHGIKEALTFVISLLYNNEYRDISEYLHHFIEEENAHMWFFAKFCMDYAHKIYPSSKIPLGAHEQSMERDLYIFASTLIFEEYVDFYNNKVGKNPHVPKIVRDINHQHHVDESRHIAFGRDVVKSLYAELTDYNNDREMTERIKKTIEGIFSYFIGLMYNPAVYADAEIAHECGHTSAVSLRNFLRHDKNRQSHHQKWFDRTTKYFIQQGILVDNSCLVS